MSNNTARVELRLYVRSEERGSRNAEQVVRAFCGGDHGAGAFALEVIDVVKHPELALEDDVRATPTLIRRSPPPTRRIVGDMRDPRKILLGLDLGADRIRLDPADEGPAEAPLDGTLAAPPAK